MTYSFSNGTAADATQVNQNFTDLINGLSDGSKALSVGTVTIADNGSGAAALLTVTQTGGTSCTVTVTGTGGATTAILSVTGGGGSYLGVGIAAPVNTLDLVGTGATNMVKLVDSTDAVAYAELINVGTGGTLSLRGTANTRNVVFNTESDSYIKTGYKLGLGTTTPSSLLTLTGGDIEFTVNGQGVIVIDDVGVKWRIGVNAAGAVTATMV